MIWRRSILSKSHGGGPRIPRSCQEQERLEHEKELLGYMRPRGDECFHESSGQVQVSRDQIKLTTKISAKAS